MRSARPGGSIGIEGDRQAVADAAANLADLPWASITPRPGGRSDRVGPRRPSRPRRARPAARRRGRGGAAGAGRAASPRRSGTSRATRPRWPATSVRRSTAGYALTGAAGVRRVPDDAPRRVRGAARTALTERRQGETTRSPYAVERDARTGPDRLARRPALARPRRTHQPVRRDPRPARAHHGQQRRAPRPEPRRGRTDPRAAPQLRLADRADPVRRRPPGLRPQDRHRARRTDARAAPHAAACPATRTGPRASTTGSRTRTRPPRCPTRTGWRRPSRSAASGVRSSRSSATAR